MSAHRRGRELAAVLFLTFAGVPMSLSPNFGDPNFDATPDFTPETCVGCGHVQREDEAMERTTNDDPLCCQCFNEEHDPRERGEDDGSTYADPRDPDL